MITNSIGQINGHIVLVVGVVEQLLKVDLILIPHILSLVLRLHTPNLSPISVFTPSSHVFGVLRSG